MVKRKALVTTAFPYLNGKLHQGHKYSYFIFEAISRILKSSDYQVLKPFSFHTTGVSLIARPNRYLLDNSINISIREKIRENNWIPLLDSYKKELVNNFTEEGINLDLEYFEYTSDLQPNK